MPQQFSTLLAARLGRIRKRLAYTDSPALAGLYALAVMITLGGVFVPVFVPLSTLMLPLFLGSLWIGPRRLPWFVVFVCACATALLAVQPTISVRSVVRVAVVFLIALTIMLASFRRSRLGVTGPRGESMLVDLRDRISRQGRIPALPSEWQVDAEIRSAGGTPFAGDFIVASKGSDHLDLVVVDVSGKGVEAGSRSLFLSGAFNGIVSALPGAEFLPAANAYLLAQDWAEGFATAIHLHLHLSTGEFELRKAGHPPAVLLDASSGRWLVLDSDGPVLGLIPQSDFEAVTGVLEPGDALLLYTDGLVETTRRDIASGIDRLTGAAQNLVPRGHAYRASRIIDAMPETDDDRALLLIHRR